MIAALPAGQANRPVFQLNGSPDDEQRTLDRDCSICNSVPGIQR